jgi:SAM-dependent methyltransferase
MANLYGDLSHIYEAMYQTFIDYSEEYRYYGGILQDFGSRSLLEVGCGTGHLATYFSNSGMSYTGIDLSEDMISIARSHNPALSFLMADMRLFRLEQKVEAAIITGRTISYLINNDDVINTFNAIFSNLSDKGILAFDCIDASKFIPLINKGYDVTHNASYEGKEYQRISHWQSNFKESWLFDWHSVYQIKSEEGKWHDVGVEDSTIRTFTKEDIALMLDICGYDVVRIEDRSSYAFDTFVAVAQKRNA